MENAASPVMAGRNFSNDGTTRQEEELMGVDRWLLAGALGLLAAPAVHAANTGPGVVTNLYVQNGVVVFQVSGIR